MPIMEQAIRLGHQIVGNLTRRPDRERNRLEQVFTDDEGTEYFVRFGILTIRTADGKVY